MAVKTRQQARTQAGDSDPLEESRELSTRPSLNKKRAARKPRQEPASPDEGHNLLLDLPPELRNTIYEHCVATEDPFYMVDSWASKKSRVPGLLSVNRQTREEVSPIFYSTNTFDFGECHAKYITQWLFTAVRSHHLKFIGGISWSSGAKMTAELGGSIGSMTAVNNVVEVYSKAAQKSAIHLSSVIMLLELGLLGPCKVKMSLYNEPRLHVACALQQLTRKLIARKKLTEVDTWNEDNVPGEDDVAGLAYAVAKDWGRSAPRAFQGSMLSPSRNALAPEMYCSSCQTVSTSRDMGREGIVSRLPWVSRIEGVESTHDQSDKASSTEANQ